MSALRSALADGEGGLAEPRAFRRSIASWETARSYDASPRRSAWFDHAVAARARWPGFVTSSASRPPACAIVFTSGDRGSFGTCSRAHPMSVVRATIAAREVTPSLAKILRKYVQTVQGLMLRTSAMTLLG